MSIRAVLFDFDGTLTRPDSLDLSVVKNAVGCPDNQPVLEYIRNLESVEKRKLAWKRLEAYEMDCAANASPNAGAEDLVAFLKAKQVKTGIISRNTLPAIHRALENFERIKPADFDIIISRDDDIAPKPAPDSIIHAAEKLDVEIERVMMAGDFIFDIQAGKQAGAFTVFIENGHPNLSLSAQSDHTVSNFHDLKEIIRMHIPLSGGKFPNELLKEVLDDFAFEDPSLLIHPGIGEDTAAVNVENEEVLVLKSDPITFATDAIGHYAVLVNANDIATSGAVPRWLLTTLLFPPGTTAVEIQSAIEELKTVCHKWHITLCGGHTEITDAVCRPVFTGMLAGTILKDRLIDKKNMQSRDRILLTKGVCVEGTSIIAREFEDKLLDLGMARTDIDQCKGFLSHISVLEEAQLASNPKETSAMHDVTEGGLATALEELSIAGGHRIRVDMDCIPIFPQTEKISRLLNIEPLGLIGSGSLLIACRPDAYENVLNRIKKAGIQASCIGRVTTPGSGIDAYQNGSPVKWPRFEVDEIARFFQE